MNLLCPNCQKQLQVDEQYAGQQMRCPLCNNLFTVPGLPDSSTPANPPPAADAPVYPMEEEEAAPPPPPPPPRQERAAAAAPVPPPPPGDYVRMKSIFISPRVVPWVGSGALLLLFLLTFFPWASTIVDSINAWGLGFGDGENVLFVFYVLLVLLALLLGIASLLIHLRIIPDLPQLRAVERWRAVIVGSLVGIAFLLLFFHLLVNLFDVGFIWLSFWGWLAFWTHLVAVVGYALEAWLQMRGPGRPVPRIDIHW